LSCYAIMLMDIFFRKEPYMSYRLYTSLPTDTTSPTRALIDRCALARNYRTLCLTVQKGSSEKPRVIAVVKADAYGHGIPICVETLVSEGCDFFAVASISEAIAVRETVLRLCARADVLIFGYTNPCELSRLVKYDLIQTLLSPEYAASLAKEAKRCGLCPRVHVAVDTGMHRVGFSAVSEQDVARSREAIAKIFRQKVFSIEGIFTHPAQADDPENPAAVSQTELQFRRFDRLLEALTDQGVSIPFRHACNSAAAWHFGNRLYDGVRFGIALYGAAPQGSAIPDLLPVMRLQTAVTHLHTLPAGEPLGYGGCFSASTDRLIATLPIGYADGLLRRFSGACVTLCTKSRRFSVPIVGRICMDQCMIDVTDTDASLGDPVILFGDSSDEIRALAAHADTIPYEILTSISARVPRDASGREQKE